MAHIWHQNWRHVW